MGGYAKIIGKQKADMVDGKKKGKDDFKLSQNVFATAVSNLISEIKKSPNKDKHSCRGHILKIIVFVSEAIRIDQIAKFIIQPEPEKEFSPFVKWMIQNWGKMSDAASKYGPQPLKAITKDEEKIIQGVRTAGENIPTFMAKLDPKEWEKVCAIILGDGIRCGYLKEGKKK